MLYRNQIYHLFSLNKIPFTNRKKITRQQSDNRQSEFNNENYHRLKIIYVKNQSCQISSSTFFLKKYIHVSFELAFFWLHSSFSTAFFRVHSNDEIRLSMNDDQCGRIRDR